MKTIGIAGLGLIGGSLVKAIKRENLNYKIVAVDTNQKRLEQAKQDGMIDEYSDEMGIFMQCDIVFVCVPVLVACDYLKELINYTNDQTIITDVGSTKAQIEKVASELEIQEHFVGGHPMAGSEKVGYEAAKANLFENAYYVLIENDVNKDAVKKVKHIVQGIGALPVVLQAEQHDEAVSMISHVPHLIASSLVNAVDVMNEPMMKVLAAGGFKDLTRIASGSPIMWREICKANANNICIGIDHVIVQLKLFQQYMQDGKNVEALLEQAKTYRDGLQDGRQSEIVPMYSITLDVDDRPGIIAEVATLLAKQSINISNIGINNSREMEGGVLEIAFYDRESRNRSYIYLTSVGYIAYKK